MPKERKPKEPQSMLGVPPWQSFVEVGDDVTLGVFGFWIRGQHTQLCRYFLTVLRYDRVYDSRDSPVFENLRIRAINHSNFRGYSESRDCKCVFRTYQRQRSILW